AARPCTSLFFFSSRRRHTRSKRDWSSDVCSSDLLPGSDAERLEAAVTRVLERIAEAKNPVFLFDQDTDRHGFTEKFRTLVDKLQIPYSQLRSEEHTSELQSRFDLVCRLLLEKKKKTHAI